jgi:hypothetical protein
MKRMTDAFSTKFVLANGVGVMICLLIIFMSIWHCFVLCTLIGSKRREGSILFMFLLLDSVMVAYSLVFSSIFF